MLLQVQDLSASPHLDIIVNVSTSYERESLWIKFNEHVQSTVGWFMNDG